MGFWEDVEKAVKDRDKKVRQVFGIEQKDQAYVEGQAEGRVRAFRKDLDRLRINIKSAGLTQRTTDELLTQVSALESKRDREFKDRDVRKFKRLQRKFSLVQGGDSTELGRRENMRFRLELAQDRPGRSGLIFGR